MYAAEPIDSGGPKVVVMSCNNDPLGDLAAATMTYEGKFPGSLAEITDEQRRFYLADVLKARRWAPMEFINIHFLITGVTRAFTHQMVRQRTAAYAQESIRFAVKEDVPVALPASLAGTLPWAEYVAKNNEGWHGTDDEGWHEQQANKEQLWRKAWDHHVDEISTTYNWLVSDGMPAEDARGLLPTNLQTRIHYVTHLRGLYEHAGNRLCTQAQHEWKVVWREILTALREYGKTQHYFRPPINSDGTPYESKFFGPDASQECNSGWQFEELTKIFKPICYSTGKCEFMSSADRYCAIRDRVQANHVAGVPPSEWGKDRGLGYVLPILDSEWMNNHAAARISQ
jgi:flavin-dependent thymidylate synthase